MKFTLCAQLPMTDSDYWQQEARRILRAQLARKNMNFKALSAALEATGVQEGAKVLSNKINRGTFSFAFFLQCMRVLGIMEVELKG